MTINWFCQAHAVYKLVRSLCYVQSIGRYVHTTSEPGICNVPSETQDFKLNSCQLQIYLGKKLSARSY